MSPVGRARSDRSVAEASLDPSHPLVGLLRRSEAVLERLLSVTAVQAAGLFLLYGNVGFGLPLAIAGLLVQAGLGCRLAALRALRREVCLELIAAGCDGLPLACVGHEERRLLDPRTLEQLADWGDHIANVATQPLPRHPAARPLFDVGVVRPVAPELRQIAALLRGDGPGARGVGALESLLTSAETPLYGRCAEPARQELRRTRYLLSLGP